MSASQDEIPPPPPPPPSSSQTPTQQTPHTVSTIKLPILKKGEYDIWAMKMEHYLAHTDYPIWEVIQNGNGPVSITTDTSGQIKVLPPRTAEEIVARERERKARTTLLMALPEDHLAKFHKRLDAKEMRDAIQNLIWFQSLLSQLEIHGAGVYQSQQVLLHQIVAFYQSSCRTFSFSLRSWPLATSSPFLQGHIHQSVPSPHDPVEGNLID
ncbi:hypothetical protein Tco_0413231 [Tanacetum coccineum]